ncbi:DUF3541 domain-containing protein [Halomonas beimenensis]|uniref:DUF3541 domain-containing protein n=1 Tax=Halomonas beimenensis TaxID=475662 RepID=A0A291P3P5_9GAMM|nr:DUF3541 domain-containing protein [Halomonas beimenensis]ATJ81490.1 hypothetical protein BEI_0503 [Halomonas beimenensis]
MRVPHPRWLWCWLLVLLAGCALDARPPARSHEAVAAEIRATYEQALPTLSPGKQRHYAQRLYRITGEARYLPLNREYGERLIDELRGEIAGHAQPGYVARRAREKLAGYPERTAKQRRRKRMLGDWREILYAKGLAFDLTQAHYHGLLNDEALPGYRRALDYLASVDFRAFLTDPEVLEVYAAQVANLVYYLHDLGVADLREATIAAFRERFPPSRDATLDNAVFRNKIYGMTHFVIAASDYYQRPVSTEEFDWVLDYFAANLERIIDETKEDIYTEVGIGFLLAGLEEAPAVTRLRDALVAAYDPRAGMIPSESGGTDLDRGEHRNVLAIMLLDWPPRLYPGPVLAPDQQVQTTVFFGKAAGICGVSSAWMCR